MSANIRKNYRLVPHPSSFTGISNVLKYHGKNVGLRKMRRILGGINSYAMHRETKKPKVRNPYFIYQIRQQIQADLIEFRDFSQSNGGVKYMLSAIDMFSKLVFCVGMPNKTADESLKALKAMVKFYKTKPRELFTDKGTEFTNQTVQKYLKQQNIRHRLPQSDLKCAGVERVNKTIQNKIYRYMTENNTRRYIDKLDDLVTSYNSSIHRTIKMSPFDAEKPENGLWVLDRLRVFYNRGSEFQKAPKFRVGDIVRIT
jgi:transposase InsO family protein